MTPGEFRRSQNWIGAPGSTVENATYVPPPPAEMLACLTDWENFLQQSPLPPLIQAALAHYQFEAIHPFLDGNGRLGRLMITLFLIEHSVLSTPLLHLSAFFEATRRDYYARLQGVSDRGEWDAWLQYFLNGVARQAEDALGRAERINRLLSDWRIAVAGTSSRVRSIMLDMLAANPFLTVKKAAKQLGVAFTTAQRAVYELERASIITETSKAKRDRVYCAKAIMAILDEPARITPLERL